MLYLMRGEAGIGIKVNQNIHNDECVRDEEYVKSEIIVKATKGSGIVEDHHHTINIYFDSTTGKTHGLVYGRVDHVSVDHGLDTRGCSEEDMRRKFWMHLEELSQTVNRQCPV
ncbi:hypothetical protein EPI10_016570 [Gossypium australe]|uniref:Uncharacterized protein n=1 Tax=Gossypium australe TaxID=47621 RepID=A0A5B6VPE5_9ROSI|nr:hypothetical protein EPI10_016570 [Gossypium australe]